MADSTSPSFMGGLMAGLNGLGQNPLFNMGLGLMSAAKPFGNVGDSLMQANQATLQNKGIAQQQQMTSYSLERMKQMMPIYQQAMEAAQRSLGGGSPVVGQSQGQPQADQPSAPTNQYQPLDPLPMVGSNAVGQINAGTALQSVPGMEKFGEALSGAPAKQLAAMEGLVKQRQQAIAGKLSNLDTIMTAPDADARLSKDQDLQALWNQENGNQPLTAPAARAFAGTVYNRLAGSAQSPVKPIPTMLQTTQRGLGETGQTDPVTGKQTAGFPALPTDKYVVNGNVVELPKGTGVKQQLQPYDSALYAAGQVTPQALEQAYQGAKATGVMPAQAGRDPIAFARESSYIAKRFNDEGINSGPAMAAKAQAYKAQQGVVDDFTNPSGTAGSKLLAGNAAILHVHALLPLIDALGTQNLTKIREARQAYQTATGVAAPTNYQTLSNFAIGEINNAINPKTGGDVGERDRLAAPFVGAKGPDVLKGAVNTAVTALGGKFEALGNSWDAATQGNQGNFGKFVMPSTARAIGWTLHKDAQGKQALVSPDGKYYRGL